MTRVRNRASRRNKSHPSCAKTLCTARRSASNARAPDSRRTPLRRRPDSASVNTPVSSRARFFASWRSCHTVRSRGSSKASNARRPRPPAKSPREAFSRRGPRVAKTRLGASTGRRRARPRGCAARRSPSPGARRGRTRNRHPRARSTYPSSSSKRPRARELAGARGGRGVVRGRPAAAAHAPVRERGDAAHGVRLRARGRARARAPRAGLIRGRGETHGHARRAHRQVGDDTIAGAAGCEAAIPFHALARIARLDNCPEFATGFRRDMTPRVGIAPRRVRLGTPPFARRDFARASRSRAISAPRGTVPARASPCATLAG